jgi:hypothetical protein
MKHSSDCRQLDDYLADDLPGPARVQFESHLDECAVCRAEVELQRAIDGALRAGSDAIELPPALAAKVNRTIHASWRKRVLALAACLAAGLLLAVGIAEFRQGEGVKRIQKHSQTPTTHKQTQIVQKPDRPEKPPIATLVQPRIPITFSESQPAIAAQLTTEDPSVTILMIYPVHAPASADDL